jgi:hypothetical protein
MIVPMLLRGEAIEAEFLPDMGMSIVSLRDSSYRVQPSRALSTKACWRSSKGG